ncbi:hypothetical protein CR513_36659, partial [Mucuna pruriens]
MNLWVEYTDIIYASLTFDGLSSVQIVHEITKQDQFLMKLRSNFESIRSNLMHRNLVPSLDSCLNHLLHEEQCLLILFLIEEQKSSIVPMAYVAHGKLGRHDLSVVQCFCCKQFGHYASRCICYQGMPNKATNANYNNFYNLISPLHLGRASNHMTSNAQLLTNIKKYFENLKIHIVDGNQLPITTTSDISSSLTNIFISPGLMSNLVFVGQLVIMIVESNSPNLVILCKINTQGR